MENPTPPAAPAFVVEHHATAEGYARNIELVTGPLGRRRLQRTRMLYVALAVSGLLLAIIPEPIDQLPGIVFAFAGIGGLFSTRGGVTGATRRRWHEGGGGGYTFNFDQDGIEIYSEYTSAAIDWLALDELRADAPALVFLYNGSSLTWLDTSAMTEADRDALVAYAHARLAEAGVQRDALREPATA
jgi:hypothetical protein